MIKNAQHLSRATILWAQDAAVDRGFRREAVEIVEAEEEDPYEYCRFTACGTVFEVSGEKIRVVEE